MPPRQSPQAPWGRSQVPSEHPWSMRPAPGRLFPFEREQGFVPGQDLSSVPGASSLLARAGLGCGMGQGSAFQSKYLHSALTHGKEQERLLPQLRGKVPGEPAWGQGGSPTL